jgi:hypothetical protein
MVMDMECTLKVFHKEKRIMCSQGKWLYPLFELETILKKNKIISEDIYVHDKIVGRAAALMLMYLGVKHIHAEILSKPGLEILEIYDIDYDYESLVEKITCKTEEMLQHENNPQKAYEVIKSLAGV